MQNIVQIIQESVIAAVQELYGLETTADRVPVSVTRKEFEGDYTVVVFPLPRRRARSRRTLPPNWVRNWSTAVPYLTNFNVVKGFLNLVVSDSYWNAFILDISQQEEYGRQPANGQKVLVEFASPNTNKPLHLGHIRNILLGWSTAQILDAVGYDVKKIQIINDRGIAICKSMLAWQKFSEGATPASTGTKPDHFVGEYYVLFEQKFQEEYKAWQESEKGQAVFAEQGKEDEAPAGFL